MKDSTCTPNDIIGASPDPLRKKSAQLATATSAYIETYGVDPTDILCEEMMSDYASGPEDIGLESLENWRNRMAEVSGIDVTKMPPQALDKMVFWERITPEWRSTKVSFISVK